MVGGADGSLNQDQKIAAFASSYRGRTAAISPVYTVNVGAGEACDLFGYINIRSRSRY
ncbi:hypothetical protein SAMN04490191_4822 [Pseudomonas lini]|uniref:Uncharacterized protein n=1 Tax=Pseudomonas lini TaxID=163011 RepID=A0A1H2AX75_9PSED|nr:hypothetical protein SAMN04490191_4822 [Pseudomonas lini]